MQTLKYQNIWDILKNNSFHFCSSLPCSLKCKFCDGILINAKQSPCGCRFCQECLRLHLANDNTACPGNDEACSDCILSLNDCIDDNYANREISQLIVKCPYYSCNIETALKNVTEHMDECKYKEHPLEEFLDDILPDCNNFESQSTEEMVNCQFCGFDFTANEIEMKHHNIGSEHLCHKFQAICPYDCGLSDLINWKSHIRVCVNRPLSCPYLELGCNADSILKMDMNEHLCKNGFEHTKILLEMITNLANEVRTGEMLMISKDSETKEIKEKLNNVEIELEQVKNVNRVLKNEMDNIRNDISAMRNRRFHENENQLSIDQCRTVLGDEVEDLRRRDDETGNKIMTLEKRLEMCDLKYEKKHLDYIWQIENYSRKTDDAKCSMDKSIVYSKPFFFAKNSYRLRLVIYPFNHNSGFVSLFFQLMKSRFDEILEWPFKYDVSLSLMDQEGRNDLEYHLFYDPTDATQQRIYQKPQTEFSESYGIQNFIKRKSLFASHDLIKNDTIFVKFSAKSINLSD